MVKHMFIIMPKCLIAWLDIADTFENGHRVMASLEKVVNAFDAVKYRLIKYR